MSTGSNTPTTPAPLSRGNIIGEAMPVDFRVEAEKAEARRAKEIEQRTKFDLFAEILRARTEFSPVNAASEAVAVYAKLAAEE